MQEIVKGRHRHVASIDPANCLVIGFLNQMQPEFDAQTSTTKMPPKADINKAGWEQSEFPILCETCVYVLYSAERIADGFA